MFCLKIIDLFQKSSLRPWTSIGRHLFPNGAYLSLLFPQLRLIIILPQCADTKLFQICRFAVFSLQHLTLGKEKHSAVAGTEPWSSCSTSDVLTIRPPLLAWLRTAFISSERLQKCDCLSASEKLEITSHDWSIKLL